MSSKRRPPFQPAEKPPVGSAEQKPLTLEQRQQNLLVIMERLKAQLSGAQANYQLVSELIVQREREKAEGPATL